uniref:RING-type domain-containing protein n=2 Tax=Vitrella brassicaformis TaxID=1169539 RepID=A0A7S1JPB6_9ALVE|mmetsp:Transcript_17953/g.43184  ORF Transcript_17953/g.43184 Transcript_17953/m.43184 type:complete len:221 (+) Transcript_17953:218-880(+)
MAALAKCGVCWEEYHHENAHKQPQVLRCGHSFCAACVEGLIRNSRRRIAVCPTCRRETSQSEVPINYQLRDIVQELRTATAAPPTHAPSNMTHAATTAVPPSRQQTPLTARQRQEAADYAFAQRLSNEINADGQDDRSATDPPNNQSPTNGGGTPLRPRTGTLPCGVQYEVVQEGYGRTPTLNQTVNYDWFGWLDAFDGEEIVNFDASQMICVSRVGLVA